MSNEGQVATVGQKALFAVMSDQFIATSLSLLKRVVVNCFDLDVGVVIVKLLHAFIAEQLST